MFRVGHVAHHSFTSQRSLCDIGSVLAVLHWHWTGAAAGPRIWSRAVRGRLGHNGCIVRLTGADSQQGSHNLCELAIALMIAER